MHLVQMLLPMYGSHGAAIPASSFIDVRNELTQRFGGVTAYTRAPAVGLWKPDDGSVERDEVVMVEVVVEALDRAWWNRYRHELEHRFHQKEILIRAIDIKTL